MDKEEIKASIVKKLSELKSAPNIKLQLLSEINNIIASNPGLIIDANLQREIEDAQKTVYNSDLVDRSKPVGSDNNLSQDITQEQIDNLHKFTSNLAALRGVYAECDKQLDTLQKDISNIDVNTTDAEIKKTQDKLEKAEKNQVELAEQTFKGFSNNKSRYKSNKYLQYQKWQQSTIIINWYK